MSKVLRSSDLRGKGQAEKRAAFDRFLKAAEPVDVRRRISELKAEIQEFEKKYQMTTAEMEARSCAGKLLETEDIAAWAMKSKILSAHLANVQQA